MKNIDLGAITNMVKNFDFGNLKSMVQSFDFDTLIDLKDMAWEYLENKGLPGKSLTR